MNLGFRTGSESVGHKGTLCRGLVGVIPHSLLRPSKIGRSC